MCPRRLLSPQVQSALEGMLRAECPAEVLSMESFTVKYHRDYEDEHTGVGGEYTLSENND